MKKIKYLYGLLLFVIFVPEVYAITDNMDVTVENDLCEGNCNGIEIISSANLSNITLSEGAIEFSSDVTEYDVTVSNFDKLDVYVELESSDSSYTIDKNYGSDGKKVVITVIAYDGDTKTYTLNVTDSNDGIVDNSDDENKDMGKIKRYIPIFVGVICLLVLINVFRIVKKIKK